MRTSPATQSALEKTFSTRVVQLPETLLVVRLLPSCLTRTRRYFLFSCVDRTNSPPHWFHWLKLPTCTLRYAQTLEHKQRTIRFHLRVKLFFDSTRGERGFNIFSDNIFITRPSWLRHWAIRGQERKSWCPSTRKLKMTLIGWFTRGKGTIFSSSLSLFHLKLFSVCGSRSPALKKEASRQLRVEFVIRRYWYSFSPLMFQGLEERGGHFLCMCVCCFRSRSARVVLHSREPCYLAIG